MNSITNVEKIKRMLLITIGVMVVMMGYYVWLYNKEKPVVAPEPDILETQADVVVNDFNVEETFNEQTLWTLQATVAEVYSAQKETHLQGVNVDFFEENENTLHLKSDYGRKDDQTGDITASGNVRVNAIDEGTVLETDEFFYNAETRKITSDKDVTITRENMLITGEGLESDISMSKIIIPRNVITTIKNPKEGASPVIIVSNMLEFDNPAQRITYTGNVIVTQDNIEMRADKMLVYVRRTEGTGDSIERIETFENVRVTQENKTITGARGEYIDKEQKATIEGTVKEQARAEDKGQQLVHYADMFEFFLSTNKVNARGNVKTVSSGTDDTE